MPEQGPGFYANVAGIKGIAAQLTDAAHAMHQKTTEMRGAMFDSAAQPGSTVGPGVVFGAMTAGGSQLGQKFDDLIAEVAGYGYALGDTMAAAAEQLHRTGDIYAKTDQEIAGN
jgi:hypothetical protein